jgi:hypothetical protein
MVQNRDRPHIARTRRWRPLMSFALLGVVFAGVGWAPRILAAAGWTAYARIVELEADFVGRIHIELDVDENPSDCKDRRHFYRDPVTGADFMYRLLVESAVRDLPVQVYVTGVCNLDRHSEISKVRVAP